MADTTLTDASTPALLGVYEEICKSYHALDDFRTKLLGLLPLTSLVGIFGLSTDSLFAKAMPVSQQLIAFIGIFAAAFTLALFIYEVRGIIRCDGLIKQGKAIERKLKIDGQFCVCVKEKECKEDENWVKRVRGYLDATLAACVIYTTVLAAWFFTVLRFGFEREIYGCAFSAVAAGLLIGIGAYLLVRKLIAA
ncbi:MAG TPA: hypothetical protein VGP08_02180 [Pyrinomonadaceae bacterium]|jgi:hypothetical protein|nr:hypothetical protein [Pyrinomonadaceae bacterium]